MAARYGQWKIASLYATHKDYRENTYARILEPELEAEDNKAKVTFTYILPTTPNAQCRLSYEVDGDGRVKTTLSYDPVKELGDMRNSA